MSNSIGNLKNSGVKGSNWPFQRKVLSGLDKILAALGGSPVVTTRTADAFRTTGSSAVLAGTQSVSIYNSGTAAGTIFNPPVALNPGEMVSFSAPNQADVLGEIPYDATPVNCEFLITTLT